MAQRQSLRIIYLVTWTIVQNGIRKQIETQSHTIRATDTAKKKK